MHAPLAQPRRREPTFAPLRLVGHEEHVAAATAAGVKPSAARAECPRCAKVFSESSVAADDRPVYLQSHDTHVVARGFFCDHCDVLILWLQTCDKQGGNFGPAHGEPAIVSDRRRVEAFLKRHPEAAGVQQK
jgi:hypothetical protein